MVKILVGLADKADAKLTEISEYLADQQMKAMDAEEGEKLALYVAKKKLGNQDIDYEPVREAGRLVGLTSFNKAAFNTASFVVSSGVIDVLRIGEGFEKFRRGEGGLLALGEDAVRALIIVNPALKGAAKVGSKVRTWLGLRAAVDASKGTLPNCGYVWAARGARLSGQSLFATIDDIGKAPGGPGMAKVLGGNQPADVVEGLKAIKVESKIVNIQGKGISYEFKNSGGQIGRREFFTIDDVAKMARWTPDEVYGVSLLWGAPQLQFGHMVGVQWSAAKGLQIIDRSGKIYTSLSELARAAPTYAGMERAVFRAEMVHVPNARFVTALEKIADGTSIWSFIAVQVALAWIVDAVPAKNDGVFRNAQDGGPFVPGTVVAVAPQDGLSANRFYTYVVQFADTPATIARAVYNDRSKWRLIVNANPGMTGDMNGAVPLGQKIFIPSVL